MDFELNDDQVALVDGIRSLLDGILPLDSIRTAEGHDRVVDPAWWKALAQAGVFSLTVPEAQGGVGLGMADAAVVFEELGRSLVPGPLVGTFLAAGSVDGAAEGAVLVGLAERTTSGPRTSGSAVPVLVAHLDDADALVVLPPAAASGSPAEQLDVPALRRSARRLERALDPLTPIWELPDGLPDGPALGEAAPAARLRRDGTILTAALQVGSAAAVVDLAVAYAKERRQFGRPIGGFQAIKHLCADMLVRSEVARCAVQAAAVLADQPDVAEAEGRAGGVGADQFEQRAVAGAKLLADEAAVANARTAVQVHGGMGFTWEVPVHLYLKRAEVLANTFGTPRQHAESVAALR